MIDDIFANNERRLRQLRKHYSCNTVAVMVNERLERKGIDERVTGSDIDGFLTCSRLGKNLALVRHEEYQAAMDFNGTVVLA